MSTTRRRHSGSWPGSSARAAGCHRSSSPYRAAAPARVLWNGWVDLGLPLAGRLISPGWHEVGTFLGPSIRTFADRYPPDTVLELWRDAGLSDVERRVMSLGGGAVIWGSRDLETSSDSGSA